MRSKRWAEECRGRWCRKKRSVSACGEAGGAAVGYSINQALGAEAVMQTMTMRRGSAVWCGAGCWRRTKKCHDTKNKKPLFALGVSAIFVPQFPEVDLHLEIHRSNILAKAVILAIALTVPTKHHRPGGKQEQNL